MLDCQTNTVISTIPDIKLTPYTYLGVGKSGNYGGQNKYQTGSATSGYPAELTYYAFSLRGTWYFW